MKTIWKAILIVLLILVLITAGYAAYLFGSYHRLGSGPAGVNGKAERTFRGSIDLVSWNIGFGAYEADYDFFMDGGKQSWAPSKERLAANMDRIAALMAAEDADVYLFQEVDTDGTRTYHMDEAARLKESLGKGRQDVFVQNFDSPFLMVPPLQPHGKNKSGIQTFSGFPVRKAARVELPVEDSVKKILDLDRCYAKHEIDLGGGRTLVLYNLHLSAYTTDGVISVRQLELLLKDIQKEYEKGNYCIAGGDFNKDLQGDSAKLYDTDEEFNWAQPIPEGTLDGYDVTLVSPVRDAEGGGPVPTARNADSPYHKGQFVVNADGFLVSDNVEVRSDSVIDTAFAYSDHNPVRMRVTLKDQNRRESRNDSPGE